MRAKGPLGVLAAVVALVTSATFLQSAGSMPLGASAPGGDSTCAVGTFAGLEANGVALCVHADAAALRPALSLPSALPGIPCYPSAGPRAHVYYAYPAGRANRLTAERAELRDLIAQTDALYQLSARDTGGTRHVRWLMDSRCHLVITPIAVSGIGNMTAAFSAVAASHSLGRYDHAVILLDWSLSFGVCGYGSLRTDSTAGATNMNNRYQGTAEIGNGRCRNATSVAHELGHTIGAVQPTAPHHSYQAHCYDGLADVMCYDDGTLPAPLTAAQCPADQLSTLDCGHDDYFNTNPARGSYLATHWNVARSALLATANPATWDAVPNPTVRLTNVTSGATYVGSGSFEDQVPTTTVVNGAGGRVTSVSFYRDDTEFLPAATAAPWSGTPVRAMLDTPGWHNIYAVVHLSDGRNRTSPIVRVRLIDPPVLSSPDGSRSVSGVLPLTVRMNAAVTPQVARVDYTVDNQVVATSATAPFDTSVDVAPLGAGTHQFAASLVRSDGTVLATTTSRSVSATTDGSSLSLRTTAVAGSVVLGTMPVSVDVVGLPAARTITSVAFSAADSSGVTDTTAPYTWAWPTCSASFGCSAGSELSVRAEVTFDDGSVAELERSFVLGAVVTAARVRLTAGVHLRAGRSLAVPYAVSGLGPNTIESVQVFTNKGYLGAFYPASSQRSVTVRVPASWRGSDAIWVHVSTNTYNGAAFSKHVPVVWTS